ncbi:hypothetical protein WJX72_011276 [[Myrmecia] bisecta]|uniref:Uncharacterized protein n=1 Tax=[Myrmecia] bisecta TaxID=41462 RepID=A0AAW1PPV2_9CHLO
MHSTKHDVVVQERPNFLSGGPTSYQPRRVLLQRPGSVFQLPVRPSLVRRCFWHVDAGLPMDPPGPPSDPSSPANMDTAGWYILNMLHTSGANPSSGRREDPEKDPVSSADGSMVVLLVMGYALWEAGKLMARLIGNWISAACSPFARLLGEYDRWAPAPTSRALQVGVPILLAIVAVWAICKCAALYEAQQLKGKP